MKDANDDDEETRVTKKASIAFKEWIDARYLIRLARAIGAVRPGFDAGTLTALAPKLESLELKDRVRLVAKALTVEFPDPREGIPLLCDAVAAADLRGFDLWPVTHYIETVGLDHFDASLRALHVLTQRFTAEFAIRPFLVRYEERCLKLLERWAEDPNVHVRRLVSEGTRPRLPWGSRLTRFVDNPTPTLKLLEKLKFDSEPYVRKSVANHLNDVSKDHPSKVIETLRRWNESVAENHAAGIGSITRHALRTLVKAGHPKALALIGAKGMEGLLEVSELRLSRNAIAMNEKLEFEFDVRALSDEPIFLVIDYVIHHRKVDGSMTAKVFKLKKCTLHTGRPITIIKRHAIRPITTRRYYPGEHGIEIQINGTRYAKAKWILK